MSDDKTVVAAQTSDTATFTGSRGCPALLQYDGGAAGKKFLLTSNEIVIGRRADKVQVWIDDASVSREHCRIELSGKKAVVTDLGSLNRSFINDQPVLQSAELRHGDMLRVGNVRLRYFAPGSADQLLFDRIYRMAVEDKMLGIFRRDYLLERLEEEFKLAKTSRLPFAMMFFDLDKFKSINDTYGHDAGDVVLKEVCHMLKTSHLQPNDVFGRYGGEEFCILLPKHTIDEAVERAEQMRAACQAHIFDYEGTTIPVTVSIGVAVVTDAMVSAQELIKAADALVYKSKQGGRNRVSRP